MPDYDDVYYPFKPDQAHVSPVSINAPWVPFSFVSTSMASFNHGTRFKFRSRHECVDWRRIGAIDVDRLANDLDFATLQENIMSITFCSIEHETCPHCHHNLDPILVKLFRLAQFTIEYLLHSQEYLTSNIQSLEEKVQSTFCDAEEKKMKIMKQVEEIKSLKEECKLRKKIIATQQMMVHAGAASYHKCQYCEKAFVNYSYLQDHKKRRHNEEKQNLPSVDKLQQEINCLREELRKAQQNAERIEKLSEVNEHKITVEQEVLNKFDNWKTEERKKFEDELKSVKEMFMNELKELTAKNSQLQNENDHKKTAEQEVLNKFDSWKKEERRKSKDELKKVKEMFMNELKELTAKNNRLENSLREMKIDSVQIKSSTIQNSLNDTDGGNSTRDTQWVKELLETQEKKWGKRMLLLQQEHEREINQIKELSVKQHASVKKYPVPTAFPKLQHVETKHTTLREQAHTLQPIPELAENKESDTEEEAENSSKQHFINALKKDPKLTGELRKILEQGLVEKLESFGMKPGVRRISNDHFSRAMAVIESCREEKNKCIPEIQQIRDNIRRQLKLKAEEQAFADGKSYTLGSTTSASLSRQTKFKTSTLKPSQEELQSRCPIPVKSSTPKVKLVSSNAACVTEASNITTPPFSSDEESDVQDVPLQPDYVTPKGALSVNGVSRFEANDSDSDGSILEEINLPDRKTYTEMQAPAKPVRAPLVKERTEQLQMGRSTRSDYHKPVGGVDVAHAFLKSDLDEELKVSDLDTDFDSSSDEEPYEVPTSTKPCLESNVHKREFPTASVKSTFGGSKLTKADAREADTSSTLVSSLVTVSDLSDTSDI